MPITPLITFKAGECEVDSDSTPFKVTPLETPGYLYLYSEDDLIRFCWRKRDQPIDSPKLDLVMVPTDGIFTPYEFERGKPSAKTNGRIFVLKFASSSQRHLFWMQSKPQGRNGDPSHFSPRDRKIGDIVNRLLQGEEVDVTRELAAVRNTTSRDDDDDEDEQMEDADTRRVPRARHGSTGGAGADATGGDVREEGEDSREGGADGARAAGSAATDADSAVRNFLASLGGQKGLAAGGQQAADMPYPYLTHLLPTSITVPMVDAASPEYIDSLLNYIPASIILLAANGEADESGAEPDPSEVEEAKESMPLDRKRGLIKKVLRSPQFSQGLGTLTMALRDGGLPSVAGALGVEVENGGYIRQGGMPLGGGQAVQAFVEAVTKTAKEEAKKSKK